MHINLWKCYNIPGSHGPMYHAQIANALEYDYIIIRYRTTNNQRRIETNVVGYQQTFANTGDYYAAPDEVQACADIWIVNSYHWVCAWTPNDGGS